MTDQRQVLVGRDATMRDAVGALRSGRSVCLTGPPGVGRTAVLRRVANKVGADPVIACFSLLADHHLVPLTAAFGPLEGDADAVAEAILAARAAPAGGLAPVAVDDAQWADGRTVDVLIALADRLPVVAAAHAGSRVARRMADAGFETVTVDPLAEHLAREVLAAGPAALDEPTTRNIVDQAAGLPLFLVHLARAATDARTGTDHRTASDAALTILDDLDDDERLALATLGMAGQPLPCERAGSGLEGLLARRLAEPVTGIAALWAGGGLDAGAWARAASPLLAEAAVTTLTDGERADVHTALAADLDPVGRAHHLLAAGDTTGAVEATHEAQRRAADPGERARAALAAVAVAGDDERCWAVLDAAEALVVALDPLDAEGLLDEHAATIAVHGASAVARAAAIRVAGLLGTTRDAAAAQAAEEALDALEALGDTTDGPDDDSRAALLAVAATAHAARLDGEMAVRRAGQALALAPAGSPAERQARLVLGAAATMVGVESGLDALAEVLADALDAGSLGEALIAGTTLGFSLFPFHRTAEGRQVLEDTAERSAAANRRRGEVHARTLLAAALVWLEQAADHVLDELGALVDDPACKAHRAGSVAMLAQGLGDRGRHGEAMARLASLAEVTAGIEMERVTADSVACELALLVGDHDAVEHHAQRVLASAQPVRMAFHTSRIALAWRAVELGETVEPIVGDSPTPALAALGRAYRGTLALADGRLDEARAELLGALDGTDVFMRRDALRCLVGASLAAAGMGEVDEAARLAARALERCRQHRLDGLAAWARRLLAPADLPHPTVDIDTVLGPAPQPLTPRQAEVLRRFVDGASPSAIAVALGLSERTVHQHLRAARQRFDAATTAEAAIRWLDATGPAR